MGVDQKQISGHRQQYGGSASVQPTVPCLGMDGMGEAFTSFVFFSPEMVCSSSGDVLVLVMSSQRTIKRRRFARGREGFITAKKI